MGTCVLVVKQQAAGAFARCLEDLGQANVDVLLSADYLPLLERNRGHKTRLAKNTVIICLGVLLELSNFTGGLSPGKSQTEDYCLVSGSYWYTKVSLPVTMS